MKITFKHVLKAGVTAAALALSGAVLASPVSTPGYSVESVADLTVWIDANPGSNYSWFGDLYPMTIGSNLVADIAVSVSKLTNVNNAQQSYLAFCIAPTVEMLGSAIYTKNATTSVSNDIRGLYELSYSGLSAGGDSAQASFQLALWELANDDGNISTGTQKISSVYGTETADAQAMILAAKGYSGPYTYSFTSFSGATPGGVASQEMLVASISAVPEADTWAMMGVGLGLIGLLSRRKSASNDKFA